MESSKYGYERINRPTNEKFESICNKYGFHLTQKEVQEFQLLMDQQLTVFDELYQMPDNLPLVKYPRTPGYYPSPEENKLTIQVLSGLSVTQKPKLNELESI